MPMSIFADHRCLFVKTVSNSDVYTVAYSIIRMVVKIGKGWLNIAPTRWFESVFFCQWEVW